jgi:hypothetical protein
MGLADFYAAITSHEELASDPIALALKKKLISPCSAEWAWLNPIVKKPN